MLRLGEQETTMAGFDYTLVQKWFGRARFQLLDLMRGTQSLTLLKELEAVQFESQEVIRFRQKKMLEAYLDSMRDVPYYKKHKSITEFPVIDKKFINENRESLLNRSYGGKIFRKKTGGSTGEPFVYVTGVKSQSYLWAGILLSWRTAGYHLGEPVAILAGSSLFTSGIKQNIYYGIMNARLFSAFEMSAKRLDTYAREIARGKYRLLYGYASAVQELAEYLLSMPDRPTFSLRGIVTTAENLTPGMRETIERAFGVPCFSQYGCHDAGISAYECEQRKGFHLITDRCYPEVLEDRRLVSTDISNEALFLPRYDTGDLITMSDEPCACGRGFPLIAAVIGRSNDVISDQAGNTVHSEFFTHLFREVQAITAFQVAYDGRTLVVNLRTRDTDTDWSPYKERIQKSLAVERIDFIQNQPFMKSANAKHKFVLKLPEIGLYYETDDCTAKEKGDKDENPHQA